MFIQKTLHQPAKLLGITFVAYLFCYFVLDGFIASSVHSYTPSLIQQLCTIISLPVTPALWVLIALAAFIGGHFFEDKLKSHFEFNTKHLKFITSSIITAGITCEILKILLGRARPEMWLYHHLSGFYPLSLAHNFHSTPSGHATIAFVLATCISILRPSWQIIGWTLASIMAISRILLNAHYLSDVILGAYLGWVVTYLIANYQYSRL